ncbi:RNA-directed DNA polymerase, eukaryota [Tanacetum coccineum]
MDQKDPCGEVLRGRGYGCAMASRHGNSPKKLIANHTATGAIGFRAVATSQRDDAERYMRGYEAYEQFLAMSNQEAGGSGSGIKRMRAYIPRKRVEAEQNLLDDYFSDDETHPKYPEENFRKGYDATSRASIDPILKCTSAIRQLAYGTSADAFDEYLQIAERCSRECLDNFTKCIYILYVEEYLRRPSLEDIEKTYALHEEKHGLPGMLESIDSVADQKLWICMHILGFRGANNDLNVLYGSPLFDDVLSDMAPEAPFVVNGRTYKKDYYLADGIYPTWSTSTYYRSSERVSDFGDYGGNTRSSGFGKFGSDRSSGFGNFSSTGGRSSGGFEETTKVSEQQQRWLCIELQPLKLAMGQQPLKPHTVATGQGLLSSLLCQIMSRFHRSLEIVENDGYTKKLCLELQHLQVARELPSLSILSSLAVYYVNLTKYSNL